MVETSSRYLSDSRLPNSIGSVNNRTTNGECGGNCEEEYVSSVYEATVTTDGNMMIDGTWGPRKNNFLEVLIVSL